MFSAIKQAIFILLCAVILAALVNFFRPDGLAWIRHREPAPKATVLVNSMVTTISWEDALEAFQTTKAVFVDARNPEKNYDEAHVPGAIKVPPQQLEVDAERFMNLIPQDQATIPYCDGLGCDLAEALARLMHQVGCEKLALLTDGWHGWHEKELPIASAREDAS